MQLCSIRLIAENIREVVGFYEQITGTKATWHTPEFAELHGFVATLAIGSTKTLQLFGGSDFLQPAQNKTAIIEFKVADVDSTFEQLSRNMQLDVLQSPTTMPWGNRSFLLRDPEGNIVNFFSPPAPQA